MRSSPVSDPELTTSGEGDLQVLVVDDEADMRLLVSVVLRPVIRSIDQASSGREAIERLVADRERYDLIVLDQRMPELDGTDVARTLRERGVQTPIILFSAYLSEDVETEAAGLGLTLVDKLDLTRLASQVTEIGRRRS